MNGLQQRTRSPWMSASRSDLSRPRLAAERSADVVVVGAGMAGLSVAFELSRAGRHVVVLDAGSIAGGMSARTTAHISDALDDWWYLLSERRGVDEATIVATSYRRAIGRIAEIVRSEGIDCDFRRVDGWLFAGENCETARLDREFAVCRTIGLDDVELLDAAPSLVTRPGPVLRFPGQARFHPLDYLAGLVRSIEAMGGQVFADTRVVKFEGGEGAWVETETGIRVRAGAIVVATNSPVNDRVAIHTKQAPYRTYAMAIDLGEAKVADALYWDTEEPYHYVRLLPGEQGDQLIVGGEDHKSGQADDAVARLDRLEGWARRHFPGLGDVKQRWSGQVMEPVDGLAFIGRNPLDSSNVYVATGDSGMGITHGAIAGMLIADLVQGRPNPWEPAFAPNRMTPAAIGTYIDENVNVIAQLKDYVRPGAVAVAANLAPGAGGLLRRGVRVIAAYRDHAGQVHEHSAICPHMGCIVHWNSLEGCWDCPCHGSQFSGEGKVLNGPARTDLASLSEAR